VALSSIDEHAMALMAILVRWPGFQDWSLVADWLSIVGSLDSISLDFGKLNPDFRLRLVLASRSVRCGAGGSADRVSH
jgi:hypothetical protein